jgi:hypothetical protein
MTIRQQLLSSIEALLDPTLVTINEDAIKAMQPDFSTFSVASLRMPFTPATPRDAIVYILAQTALQYRFWDGFGADYRRYSLDDKVGSAGMVAGFDKAWGSESTPGVGILVCAGAPQFRSRSMPREVLEPYFGDIPDPVSRVEILHEVLSSKHLADVVDQLDQAFLSGHVGVEQALLISKAFPRAYGDDFIKKSMLAVGLILAEYRRAGFVCTESLMAYADYQVPAVLRHLGILVYSKELAAMVDGRQRIKKGSREELAIRAATIIACEMFARIFGVTAAETDWFFWLMRKLPVQPFHLTDDTEY